jgi:hypothetical protein
VRTTCSNNGNASSGFSMRQPRPEPADPVNSANIDCVAVVIAPRIRDRSRLSRAAEITQRSPSRSTAITLTPGPSVHVDFARMRLNTGHEVTNR